MLESFTNRLFSTLLLLSIALFTAACDAFEYSPNQIILDDDEQNINAKNIAKLSERPSDDTVRIILMGDTQRFYDQADDFVKSANKQKNVDFVIHAGDISDFGLSNEFEWINEIMATLEVPYMAVVGNHDLLANGPKVYREMFGPYNFSFAYSGVKFIFFNSNAREYAFDGTVPDLEWLGEELADTASFDKAILVSHVPPFDVDADPDKEKDYAKLLSENGKVALSLHGHQHSFSIKEPYKDGITYVVATSVEKRGYALITLYDDTFEIEKVFY